MSAFFAGGLLLALHAFTAGCGGEKNGDIEKRIDKTLSKMSLEEKVEQMHGTDIVTVDELWVTADNERLQIPGFKMVDGPRGVRAGFATTFPVGMARGATWDPDLELRVGEAMGLETAAKGGNVLLAPCINILRHPGWGRAQETYGEDPFHMGRMGVAFVQGAQRHVIATAKHFALNSIEETRFEVDVSVDERTLREIYLPHFRAAVQEGRVGAVMTAYNLVGGYYCSENSHLLRDILKGEWGFDGFVMSDWVYGTRSTAEAANAGLDVEMPAPLHFGGQLVQAVLNGEVSEDVIDDAVRRILRKKFQFGLDEPVPTSPDVVESAAHIELALEVERKAMVLLKNVDQALPLDPSGIDSVAVVGALADTVNLGDLGSSNCVPSYAVTILEGIQDRAEGSVTVEHVGADELSSADATTVAGCDAAVVVVGLTAENEGEYIYATGGDRESLDLPADQQALIADVAALNGRTIVVLMGGSAITMGSWIDAVQSLLMVWYPGQEGGHAVADVLFGHINPSGKLPITFPADLSQLPEFINDQTAVTYGYYHGYRHVDRENFNPLFPFGFGLSYTTFGYGGLVLGADRVGIEEDLLVSVDVTNTGTLAGEEVVQLYVGYEGSAVDRPERELKAFARVLLEPGETRSVGLVLRVRDLAYYDVAAGAWLVERIPHTVYVGSSSRDLPLQATFNVQ